LNKEGNSLNQVKKPLIPFSNRVRKSPYLKVETLLVTAVAAVTTISFIEPK
jgi:hypothetical protein